MLRCALRCGSREMIGERVMLALLPSVIGDMPPPQPAPAGGGRHLCRQAGERAGGARSQRAGDGCAGGVCCRACRHAPTLPRPRWGRELAVADGSRCRGPVRRAGGARSQGAGDGCGGGVCSQGIQTRLHPTSSPLGAGTGGGGWLPLSWAG